MGADLLPQPVCRDRWTEPSCSGSSRLRRWLQPAPAASTSPPGTLGTLRLTRPSDRLRRLPAARLRNRAAMCWRFRISHRIWFARAGPWQGGRSGEVLSVDGKRQSLDRVLLSGPGGWQSMHESRTAGGLELLLAGG